MNLYFTQLAYSAFIQMNGTFKGSGLYGRRLYGGTLPTYESMAELSQNADSTAELEKMRTLRRSFSKNTYPTTCGPWLSLYIYIFINEIII